MGEAGWTVHAYGPSAVLVEVSDSARALSLARLVRDAGLECTEVVPAARTVLLDGLADPAALADLLARWTPGREERDGGRRDALVEVPVRYDGADLERVAALWEVDVDTVVARHSGLEYVSAFCGFAPGFAYLSGLPREWALPRLEEPRPRVPAGSVAVADTWCGVYPSSSPGGWLLLGTTDLAVWDETRDEHPALLAPGTRVRFVAT